MPATKAKPQTPLAKEIAAQDADHRAAYDKFDADVVRFGRVSAAYNAGWVRGVQHAEGKRRTRRKG